MGLLKKLGSSLVGGAVKHIQTRYEDMEIEKARIDHMSDKQLRDVLNSTKKRDTKLAAAAILKKRERD